MIRVAAASVLVLAACALSRRARLSVERELLISSVRAIAQLGAIALVLRAVFDHLGFSGLFIAVMLTAAARTAGRRLRGVPRANRLAGVVIGGAAVVTLGPMLLVGAFPATPRYVIPLAGIVIGGAMKAASLAGTRLCEELSDRHREVEARLALGDSARQALHPCLRRAVSTALVPAVDQTKNVGLVTLPGAFVGMLLGGASPLEAALVQLTILLVLLAAEAVAATLTTVLVVRTVILPGERVLAPS